MRGRGRAHSGARALSIDKVPKVLPLSDLARPVRQIDRTNMALGHFANMKSKDNQFMLNIIAQLLQHCYRPSNWPDIECARLLC
jgi:hypothetical protein